MSVKFSNAQIAFIRASGKEVGDYLRLPLSFLAEITPLRVRTSEDERLEKFGAVLGAVPASDTGVKVVSILALADAGLPFSSLTNPAYWSGIGDGSCVAHDAGYKSRYVTVRDGESVKMTVVLTPLSDDDRAAHQKRLAKADAKAAATKAAKAAAKATAGDADTDEGSPDSGDDSGDEGESATA